jgi:hypothetical protein
MQIYIVLYIRTKSSANRLKAGIAEITLTNSSQILHKNRVTLLKCHDPAAYLEYSLRIGLNTTRSSRGSTTPLDDNP